MAKRNCLMTSYPTDCKDDCFSCKSGGAEATKDMYVSIHNVQRVCSITGGAADTDEGEYIAEVIRNNLENLVIEVQPARIKAVKLQDEYISREAVKQVLCGIANGLSVGETEALKSKDMKALYKIKAQKEILDTTDAYLSFIPAAGVQPVVCCKDCKHRRERHYEESGEMPYIKYECKFTKYSMSDDGFCSFGVRMDGDKE